METVFGDDQVMFRVDHRKSAGHQRQLVDRRHIAVGRAFEELLAIDIEPPGSTAARIVGGSFAKFAGVSVVN